MTQNPIYSDKDTQQHLPAAPSSTATPGRIVVLSADGLDTFDDPILSLICFAIVKKACSTLVASFADVSKNGIPS